MEEQPKLTPNQLQILKWVYWNADYSPGAAHPDTLFLIEHGYLHRERYGEDNGWTWSTWSVTEKAIPLIPWAK